MRPYPGFQIKVCAPVYSYRRHRVRVVCNCGWQQRGWSDSHNEAQEHYERHLELRNQ